MRPRCNGCNAPLTHENDSAAHIIPKALGGRLSPKGLICRKCNTALDAAADNALIKAFGSWPTLLAIPRQGNNPPKFIETRDGHQVRVEPDGSMTRVDVVYDVTPIPEGHSFQVAAGDYRMSIRNIPFGFYVKEARFGEVDALKEPIRVANPNSDTLEIVLSAAAGQLDGRVSVDQEQLGAGAQVVLVPTQRNRSDLFKTAFAGTDGRFFIGSIAPGEYELFAWDSIEPYAFFDPDLLARSKDKGLRVHVGELSKQSVELRVIPAPWLV